MSEEKLETGGGKAARIDAGDPLRAALLREHAGQLQRALAAPAPEAPERCRCPEAAKWGAGAPMPSGHHWHRTGHGGYLAHDVPAPQAAGNCQPGGNWQQPVGAATPPMALAAELAGLAGDLAEPMAAAFGAADAAPWEEDKRWDAAASAAAEAVRERLAPAWDALAARLAEARAALESIEELAVKAKPIMWWNGTRSEAAWTLDKAAVADIARAALGGAPDAG